MDQPAALIAVSVVSYWEIAIKISLRKYSLTVPVRDLLALSGAWAGGTLGPRPDAIVSYWEIAIKAAKGIFEIDDVGEWWQRRALLYVDAKPIHVREEHVTEILRLPRLHKDPFDRMLIAQARVENLPLVTSDKLIRAYDVRTVW